MSDRTQVIAPDLALDSTEVPSSVVDITGFGQLGIEVDVVDLTGDLSIVVELGPDDNAFYPEGIEDPSTAVLSPPDMAVPVYRYVRTWSDTSSIAFQVPCAGYKKIRLKVKAGTSAHVAIYVNKLRLAAN